MECLRYGVLALFTQALTRQLIRKNLFGHHLKVLIVYQNITQHENIVTLQYVVVSPPTGISPCARSTIIYTDHKEHAHHYVRFM